MDALHASSWPAALGLASAIILVLSLLASFLLRRERGGKGGAPACAAENGHLASNGAAAAPEEEDSRSRCTILFGTQTGTAERFAKSLRAQLESKYGVHTSFDVVDIENYDAPARLPREALVLLLMATYGDGEPTDSATDFYEWLGGEHAGADEPLTGVSFAVFGLGNRQYEHFCAMGARVHKLMEGLGGAPVLPHGEGDDDADIDADFDSWSAQLFDALDASALVRVNTKAENRRSLNLGGGDVDAYGVELLGSTVRNGALDTLPAGGTGLAHGSPLLATVSAARELHAPGSGRSCVHVELDVGGSKLAYEAGDHVGIFAENSPEVVEAAAAALGVPPDTAFRLTASGQHGQHQLPPPFEGPVTLRCALARHADLLSAPSKAALQALAAFATDPGQAARLRELASIEGRDAYHAYVISAKRSLLEVLQDFPSARPTLGAFFASVAPRLQPRYYSISSAPAAHPRSIHVTCAVVRETMPSGRVHEGVASTWLARLKEGDRAAVFVRRSSFKLPADPATPVVMVGPGTGLAPFRGFLQEREALLKKGAALGPSHLFFGCRRRDADFIYADELEGAVARGALGQLHVAFSREGSSKDYVQHHMQRHGAEVWDALSPARGGVLYVCGDAGAMAKDVHRTLHAIAQQATRCSSKQAEEAVKQLSDSGRYLKDVW